MTLHNSSRGARYTRGRGPVRAVYHETFASRGEAQRREAVIKRLSRAEKQALVAAGQIAAARAGGDEGSVPGPPLDGVLYLCPTPIGNLEDITLRALRVLREADVVAAEDTRQTRKLLRHHGISASLLACHAHNERRAAADIVERLRQGKIVALVTDAGAPTVSDPGAEVARAARAAGFPVVALPGPSAVITALSGSGLPADRFVFDGFLPRAGAERRRRVQAIAAEPRAIVLFEAPTRVVRTLRDLAEAIGDRPVAVARELTKKFEEHRHGTATELADHYERVGARGEFTLVVAPSTGGDGEGGRRSRHGTGPATSAADGAAGGDAMAEALAEVAERIRTGGSTAEAVKATARARGVPRRELYRTWAGARRDASDGAPDHDR